MPPNPEWKTCPTPPCPCACAHPDGCLARAMGARVFVQAASHEAPSSAIWGTKRDAVCIQARDARSDPTMHKLSTCGRTDTPIASLSLSIYIYIYIYTYIIFLITLVVFHIGAQAPAPIYISTALTHARHGQRSARSARTCATCLRRPQLPPSVGVASMSAYCHARHKAELLQRLLRFAPNTINS